METWAEVLGVCGKFALAVILAGAIGMERQLKGHAAGLRTHILVCLGATLMMIVSDELAQEMLRSGINVWLDKGRIAAGIITGIGFLGAGAIINVGSIQRGLTTAAMIWLVAGLGIAIGAGYWPFAVCATVFALIMVIGLEYVEQRLPEYERLSLTVRMPRGQDNFREIEQAVGSKGFKVAASRVRVDTGDKHSDMTFDLQATGGIHIEELTEFLEARFPSAERITFERS